MGRHLGRVHLREGGAAEVGRGAGAEEGVGRGPGGPPHKLQLHVRDALRQRRKRREIRVRLILIPVAHGEPVIAAVVRMAVLERGGNAFDAAVAAGFTLQVVEPHLNGPGGEVPAVFYSVDRGEPLVLCDLQGMPYDEIAQALGMPLGTVKSRINRGRLELAKRLVDRQHEYASPP